MPTWYERRRLSTGDGSRGVPVVHRPPIALAQRTSAVAGSTHGILSARLRPAVTRRRRRPSDGLRNAAHGCLAMAIARHPCGVPPVPAATSPMGRRSPWGRPRGRPWQHGARRRGRGGQLRRLRGRGRRGRGAPSGRPAYDLRTGGADCLSRFCGGRRSTDRPAATGSRRLRTGPMVPALGSAARPGLPRPADPGTPGTGAAAAAGGRSAEAHGGRARTDERGSTRNAAAGWPPSPSVAPSCAAAGGAGAQTLARPALAAAATASAALAGWLTRRRTSWLVGRLSPAGRRAWP